MRQRRHAADGKPGARLDERRIRAAQPPAVRANQRLDLFFIDTPVARGDDQHRHIVRLAAKNDALGNLAARYTQGVSRLLRGAGGVVEHDGRMRMALGLQHIGYTLHAFGQHFQFSTAHQFALLFSKAVAARELGLRPRKSLMNWPASISLSRSMPVSMPMPCSK